MFSIRFQFIFYQVHFNFILEIKCVYYIEWLMYMLHGGNYSLFFQVLVNIYSLITSHFLKINYCATLHDKKNFHDGIKYKLIGTN